MSTFVACPECNRHVRSTETTCPFCAASVGRYLRNTPPRVLPTVRLTRAAMFTFATAAACSSPTPEGYGNQEAREEGTGGAPGASAGGAGGTEHVYVGMSGGAYGLPPYWGDGGQGGTPTPTPDAAPPPVDAEPPPSDAPADAVQDAAAPADAGEAEDASPPGDAG